MKKCNVLMAHNYYQVPGGEDTVFHNEVEMLKKNGHKVIKYTRHNDKIKESGIFGKLKLATETVFSFKTYKEVRSLIDKNDIHVVHVHNTLPLISPSIYYAAISKKVPVVQTIHNFRLLCPGATFTKNGHICEDCLSKGLRQSLKNKCYRNSLLQTYIMYFMLKFHKIIGTYNKINYITLTEFNKNKILNLVKDDKKVFIKPNFISKKEKTQRNLEDYFIYIGRLDEIKGINFLVNSWKDIDKNIKLYIIGDGPEKENIEKYIKESKINNIKLLGFMDRLSAFEIIEKSRAIIVPSKWYEGFPMTIAESFSLGVPVIGSNIGNIGCIVNDENNGLLFEKDNKQSLKEVVERVFYNKQFNIQLGNNAYNTFLDYYTDEENYNILQNIYSRVVGDNLW
ncbi:glycosyltransferase family 4 protein [Tepidibacter formicigenes]|jgi:glycosyltransferase involved in cell wall biosynthesis|uniref:Glycosyltransferase involved in cell wall bisynthesis n=1 Tax=Tepidibacter formicigenes DSM 15518 TaxID=1123349 RepID=A0A1M6QDR9_9FIRM|nr:glycosyltransferase family 4 protein [Tepidibacter formicigenes]SHK18341.1 Glycosyltransferase involved in cell wall bisynthesis [Tepidibacter formicigenes DSM 15518]